MEQLLNRSEESRSPIRWDTAPITPTLGGLGRQQIEAICSALDIEDQTERALATFDVASSTWADRTIDQPPVKSDITDDSSPYEFSVAFDNGAPDLRLLVEAQASEGGLLDSWNAAWRLSEQLEQNFGASLASARRVASLFEPTVRGLTFSLWHAASFRSKQPAFRVYFNPQAQGASQAMPNVLAAFETLGMPGAAAWMKRQFAYGEHKPLYFSVDLSNGPTARCKVYLAHPGANADHIESLIGRHGDHRPGDLGAFCRSMTGSDGDWTQRPPLTCFAFRGGSDVPYTVTLHVPIRCYAPNDAVALERISAELTSEQATAYQRAVRSLAHRPLDSATGIQTYASVRREGGRRRMTIYLSPEAYRDRSKSPVC